MKGSFFCIVGIAAMTALCASVAVATPVPLALWDFESDSGAPIAAGSTHSRSFDGSTTADIYDAGMVANDIPGFGGTDPFTIYATFQVDGSHTTGDPYDTIFDYSPSSAGTAGADIRIYAKNDGKVRLEASVGAGWEGALGGVNVYDHQVHTIAVIADGGENFNDMHIYLDGTVYSGMISAGNNAAMNLAGAGRNITMGVDHRTITGVLSSRNFGGLIDDVAIFGSALSEAELNDLRASGVPAPVPEPATVALCLLGAAALLAVRRK